MLLNGDVFHEVAKYISLQTFLTLRYVCRKVHSLFKKEIKGGWILESIRRYFTLQIPEISFDKLHEAILKNSAVLYGPLLTAWSKGYCEENRNTSLSFSITGMNFVGVFKEINSLPSNGLPSSVEKYIIEDLFIFPTGKRYIAGAQVTSLKFCLYEKSEVGHKLRLGHNEAILGNEGTVVHSAASLQFFNHVSNKSSIMFNGRSIWIGDLRSLVTVNRKRKRT